MENQNYWLKKFLSDNGFIPRDEALNIVSGVALRNGMIFETRIVYNLDEEGNRTYQVSGHGDGLYIMRCLKVLKLQSCFQKIK